MAKPPLRPLHSTAILSQVKLDEFRKMGTAELIGSLRPGQSGGLKTKADGTVMEGHHRLVVLRERGVEIDVLPREVFPQESES